MTKHRSMEHIDDALLSKVLNRIPDSYYVYWTGGTYGYQEGSLRSQALRRIREAGTPISVKSWLRSIARIDGEIGYDPDIA